MPESLRNIIPDAPSAQVGPAQHAVPSRDSQKSPRNCMWRRHSLSAALRAARDSNIGHCDGVFRKLNSPLKALFRSRCRFCQGVRLVETGRQLQIDAPHNGHLECCC